MRSARSSPIPGSVGGQEADLSAPRSLVPHQPEVAQPSVMTLSISGRCPSSSMSRPSLLRDREP
jgi:hypothetical protein